jgi:hypothetical protein
MHFFAVSMGSALGAPASRRLGLTMAAKKAKEPNGAALGCRKIIGIRKYSPPRRLMPPTFCFLL